MDKKKDIFERKFNLKDLQENVIKYSVIEKDQIL